MQVGWERLLRFASLKKLAGRGDKLHDEGEACSLSMGAREDALFSGRVVHGR